MKFAVFLMGLVGVVIGSLMPVSRPVAVAPVAAPAAGDAPRETVLEREDSGHFLTVADVNGEPIRFLVDTGADVVALTTEDAKRAHVFFDTARFEPVGRGASGEVRGQRVRVADLVLDGKRASDVDAVVLEGSPVSLLGQTYLRKMASVHIEGDRMTLR